MIRASAFSAGQTAHLLSRAVALPPSEACLPSSRTDLINAVRELRLPDWNGHHAAFPDQAEWERVVEAIDRCTPGHTRRVAQISLQLAAALRLPSRSLEYIYQGCLLHDIGKIWIPNEILLKPGSLDPLEVAIVRQHPITAYQFLFSLPALRQAMEIPYCHHEKFDGTGYPRGLSGEGIPLPARITAVADVWDALTSDRPYREAWSASQSAEHMLAESGRHFDPSVVRALIILFEQGELQ